MKIVLINSSGRTKGNTARLLNVLENELIKAAGRQPDAIDIRHVNLSEPEIKACRGCRCCFDRGGCPIKDAAAETEALIAGCDVLVLAGPVSMEDVNGAMKTWIDRMAFHAHRPAFYGKYAIAISTSGAGSSDHALHTMKNALTAWGFHILGMHKFRMGAWMEDKQIEEKYLSKLSDMAANLIISARNNVKEKPPLFALISFRIQQKYYRTCNRAGAPDRAYWEGKGWLDSDAHFYMPVKSSPVKLLLANVIGGLLSNLFS